MSDLISRKEAIDALAELPYGIRGMVKGIIEHMPSAQPETERTGKWITDNPNNPYESDYCKCSICGYINCTVEVLAFDGYKHCPNCGARMRGDAE